MSGIEIVGLALGVAGIATDTAFKLSIFSRTVKNAGKSISYLHREVSEVETVTHLLSTTLTEDGFAKAASDRLKNAIKSALESCKEVLGDINATVAASGSKRSLKTQSSSEAPSQPDLKPSLFQRLKFSLVEEDVVRMRDSLRASISSLGLLVQLLISATYIKAHPGQTLPDERLQGLAIYSALTPDATLPALPKTVDTVQSNTSTVDAESKLCAGSVKSVQAGVPEMGSYDKAEADKEALSGVTNLCSFQSDTKFPLSPQTNPSVAQADIVRPSTGATPATTSTAFTRAASEASSDLPTMPPKYPFEQPSSLGNASRHSEETSVLATPPASVKHGSVSQAGVDQDVNLLPQSVQRYRKAFNGHARLVEKLIPQIDGHRDLPFDLRCTMISKLVEGHVTYWRRYMDRTNWRAFVRYLDDLGSTAVADEWYRDVHGTEPDWTGLGDGDPITKLYNAAPSHSHADVLFGRSSPPAGSVINIDDILNPEPILRRANRCVKHPSASASPWTLASGNPAANDSSSSSSSSSLSSSSSSPQAGQTGDYHLLSTPQGAAPSSSGSQDDDDDDDDDEDVVDDEQKQQQQASQDTGIDDGDNNDVGLDLDLQKIKSMLFEYSTLTEQEVEQAIPFVSSHT